MSVCVAAVQAGPYRPDYDCQMAKLETLVTKARKAGADIICLPELMTTPYFACSPKAWQWRDRAEPLPGGPTFARVSAWAKTLRCWLIGTCYEQAGGRRYNTAFVVSPDGEMMGRHRKAHIPLIEGNAYEPVYFDAGDDLSVFDIMGVCAGILICYERCFPEAWRTLALKGAEIIFVPTSSSGFRGELYAEEIRVAAAQQQVFVVAANKAGEEAMEGEKGPISFYGKSRIISPSGRIVAALEAEEDAVITAEIDMDEVAAVRRSLAYYRDRRIDLYQL